MVRAHVPKLLDALLVCFKDESWPVRDGEWTVVSVDTRDCGHYSLWTLESVDSGVSGH